MSYQPFLIANFATGFDRQLQPWLLPNDAFTDLEDGYVYRGVVHKRDGYSGYANGLKSIYTESRMVHNITFGYTLTGDIDGLNDTYTIQAIPPIIPTSVKIVGSNPVQTITDDGLGALMGDGTGTVDYVTGAISVTFTAPPAVASTVTMTYGNFSVGDGTAGPYIVTLANSPLRRGTITITAVAQVVTDDGEGGFNGDGIGTIDYTTGEINVTFNAVVTALDPITITYDYHPGNPVMGIMNFYPTNNIRELIVADTQYVNRYNRSTDVLDDISPATPYIGTSTDFWSWVNYADASFNPRLLFSNGVPGDVIQQYNGTSVSNYSPTFSGGSLNARQMFIVRDRLLLFQTIEAGTLYPRRIRISGTGANSDNFNNTAPGAGFIDIPDNTHFFGADFNRDDVLFFTEAATWMLKYTGNDVTPFVLEKIDGSRGSQAAFSVISYLNRTMAASTRGLIISDGYQVERMDDNLPDYTIDSISSDNFNKCFSGFIDQDRDVYMIYPSKGEVVPSSVPEGSSDRILVVNFEEDNFAVYRLPLSCMGSFETAFAILWSDLTAENGFPDWDSLQAKFGNWNSFPFSKNAPIAIGGGHKGEIWKLNDTDSLDNPLKIRDITVVDDTRIQVTTDWNNYSKGDYISFEAVGGMVEINHKQGSIDEIVTDYYTFIVNFGQDHGTLSAYTSGGIASRVIPLNCSTKKFNPYIELDKKLRCGWVYFYVDVAETTLTEWGTGDEERAFLDIEVLTNNNEKQQISSMKYKIDCTAINNELGGKKWVKIWINQVGQFLQFNISNVQAGAKPAIHAIVLGLQPVGRLI